MVGRRVVERVDGDRHRHLRPRAKLIGRCRRHDTCIIQRHQLEAVAVVLGVVVLINQLAGSQVGGRHDGDARHHQNAIQFQRAIRHISGDPETQRLITGIAGFIVGRRVVGIGQHNMAGGNGETPPLNDKLRAGCGCWRIVLRRDVQRKCLLGRNELSIRHGVNEPINEILAPRMREANLAIIDILLGKCLIDEQRAAIEGHIAAGRQAMKTVDPFR